MVELPWGQGCWGGRSRGLVAKALQTQEEHLGFSPRTLEGFLVGQEQIKSAQQRDEQSWALGEASREGEQSPAAFVQGQWLGLAAPLVP